ncbi:dihydroorotate oxidase B, electron transfer subunit [Syntrophus gentianae]|uniref:Dihydroorotate dehydrogenase B (NAD(+)), electron transfer subunit n=1 Tax=Syntrophus gentianae TaxID=43775 RepID=A0A1H7XN27_9BACT|nr:dihydroorotate dehydrogenase electron transfer subunit [Syntrophus gentianae]SEM35180.1 dihydroorotate oxidase B, electron transfer subunit [Syntrophus gentianae]
MQPIPISIEGKILINREVIQGHFLLRVKLAPAFPHPLPGQFVMIRVTQLQTPLLARPMSIYAFEQSGEHAFLEIFYRVAGEGTKLLSCLKAGQEITLLGPLGKGFSQNTGARRVILIAGGIGISPLTFLASSLIEIREPHSLEMTVYLGAQHQGVLAGLDRLSAFCSDIRICTDDGSAGYPGRVTDLFERELADYSPEDAFVYACGPHAMMRRLAELLEENPLPCQVSVEERMACGLGACLGCAVPIKTSDGISTFRRVCKDGPVFDIRQITW